MFLVEQPLVNHTFFFDGKKKETLKKKTKPENINNNNKNHATLPKNTQRKSILATKASRNTKRSGTLREAIGRSCSFFASQSHGATKAPGGPSQVPDSNSSSREAKYRRGATKHQ
jgi:hypothetical protein